MREYYELGPTPCDESCAQVGEPDYHEKAKKEMTAYVNLLNREFPQARDKGILFVVKWFAHDFGRYGEVVAGFSDEDSEAVSYVFDVIDKNLPSYWDNEARKELGISNVY